MVNLGRSWACRTCKQRRIKCDETEPACNRCKKSGLTCPGYHSEKPLKIRFKDETKAVTYRARELDRGRQFPPKIAMHDDSETLGFNFFIQNWVRSGRRPNASRGLFEHILPILTVASPSSPAIAAATSVGVFMLAIWQHEYSGHGRGICMRTTSNALKNLRSGLQGCSADTVTQQQGLESLLAILLLQWQENIAAVYDFRTASGIHYHGALALIRQLSASGFPTPAQGMLLGILNTEVALAIRKGQPVDPTLIPWFMSLPKSRPLNPANTLNLIGIQVANIQHRFNNLSLEHAHCASASCPHTTAITSLHNEILSFETACAAWHKALPQHWQPHPWRPSAQHPNLHIPMYNNTCTVFHSVQIASTYNTYLGYRLHISRFLSIMHSHAWLLHTPSQPILSHIHESIQSLVDALCAAIPFFLGTYTAMLSLHDLTLPPSSEHSFPSFSNMRDPPPTPPPDGFQLSEEEHTRHVTAQGAWHAMVALTQVVSVLRRHGEGCGCLEGVLREGQGEWVRGQLFRAMGVVGVERGEGEGEEEAVREAVGLRASLR